MNTVWWGEHSGFCRGWVDDQGSIKVLSVSYYLPFMNSLEKILTIMKKKQIWFSNINFFDR